MKHELKTLPTFFNAILNGHKTFEWRKNDRNFVVGDTVVLQEWSEADEYSGREITASIDYLLKGFAGMAADYCVFSFTIKHVFNP